MGAVTKVWVSLWVVRLKHSFVFDRPGSVRREDRCFNGVWQGVVGSVGYACMGAATPRYRRRSAAE